MTIAVGPFFLGRPSAIQQGEAVASCTSLPYNFPHVGATRSELQLPPDLTPERGWAVDRHALRIGTGRAAYDRARALVADWRHFDLGWAFTNAPEVKQGAGVVVTARSLGLWSCNPLRICFVEEGRFDRQRCGGGSRPATEQRWQQQWWGNQQQGRERRQSGSAASSRSAASGGQQQQRQQQQQQQQQAAGPPPRVRRFTFGHATLAGHQICGEERFAVSWAKDGDDSVWYEVFTVSRPATPLAALMRPLLRHYQARFARESMAIMAAHMAAAEGGKQRRQRGHGNK